MCEPISIGIAIGAATGAAGAAITGGDPLQGALIGGITGGVTGGMGGLGAGSTSASVGSTLGASTSTSFINAVGSSVTQAGALGFGAMSLGGSVAMGMLAPKTPEYNAQSYGYSPIAYNSQQNTVTGSGGAQASALLASEIQRVQRSRQGTTNTSALNTQPFQTTGLQLA